MKLTAAAALAALSVAVLASSVVAQTEPPICDPAESLPTGEQCPAYDGVEFTFYYADPEHCQQYWQCLYGCASQKVCPDGYLFDDFQEMCMPAADVNCGDRDCDGQPCEVAEFTCPSPDGQFADPENCIKYQDCTGGSPMRETCPLDSSGLQQWFDSTSGACGEQTVEACAGVPVCDVYDGNCHDAEDFFVTPTPEPFFKCPEADGWFEDPCNCIKYYRCDSYVADHRTCEKSGTTQLHWEQANIWCDYPSNVYCGDRPVCDENDENCTGGTANTPEECAAGGGDGGNPGVTDDPGTGGGGEGGACANFEGECQGNEIVDEGECEQCFCQCTSLGHATENCCGEGLLWNPDAGYCDWPYNMPGCS